MNNIKNIDLVRVLRANRPGKELGFIEKLKVSYRPYICPFNELLETIPENEKVFDVGCGSGMFLFLVNKFRNPSQLYGIEIDERLIENAKDLFVGEKSKSTFSVFDGEVIPEQMKDYNYITLIDVLHHVPLDKQQQFLIEIYNKMSKNSTLILKDINSNNPFFVWNKIHDFVFSGEIGNEPNPTSLMKLLQNVGFEIESINYKMMFLYPHFTLICKKK